MVKTEWVTRHKDTNNSIATVIKNYVPKGFRSYSMNISTHISYAGTDNGLEVLQRAEKRLKQSLEGYRKLRLDEWFILMVDVDYPKIPFGAGSSFLQLEVTAIRKWKETDYDTVEKPLLAVKDFVITSLTKNEGFSFSEKKIKRNMKLVGRSAL